MSQRAERARALRRTQTPYEATLWKLLRNRQLEGYKFRRQCSIGPYFADFACCDANLVVELDGNSHDEREDYDQERDTYLMGAGWRVLRISNRDLSRNLEGVWLEIKRQLENR